MSELTIIRNIIIIALVTMFLIVMLDLIHPEYAAANFTKQTEIPVNKLKCTDIRDGICIEWTEYKIVRH